jgi:enoyl-[acyl-carrier-protein] reductase (NADH)
MPFDVTVDEQIDAMAARLTREWGQLDILVHAVASRRARPSTGAYRHHYARAFRIAHDVSATASRPWPARPPC